LSIILDYIQEHGVHTKASNLRLALKSFEAGLVADPRGAIGAITSLKPTKVTFFTEMFYNSENNISKLISKRSIVIFEMPHCLQYKAILSTTVLSQQCCEVLHLQKRSRYAQDRI